MINQDDKVLISQVFDELLDEMWRLVIGMNRLDSIKMIVFEVDELVLACMDKAADDGRLLF